MKQQVELRVLVVEDEHSLRILLLELLRRSGYEATAVATRDEAICLAKSFRPHLAIVDLKLPGENGLGLVKVFKEMFPDMRAIILTGYALSEQEERALMSYACTVMRKPFDIHELSAEVSRVLADVDREVSLKVAEAPDGYSA